jgi:hypothetical protein
MIFGGGRNAGKIASAEDWQAKVDRILFFYANGLSREEALAWGHDEAMTWQILCDPVIEQYIAAWAFCCAGLLAVPTILFWCAHDHLKHRLK